MLQPVPLNQTFLWNTCGIGSRPHSLRSRRARYPSRCKGKLGDAAGHPEAADAQPGHDHARGAAQSEHGRVSERHAPLIAAGALPRGRGPPEVSRVSTLEPRYGSTQDTAKQASNTADSAQASRTRYPEYKVADSGREFSFVFFA